MKSMYVKIPEKLTENDMVAEYGMDALRFYKNRIAERIQEGRTYYNPLKTIYIWAVQDRKYHQGYWSTWFGYNKGKKRKNHGRS